MGNGGKSIDEGSPLIVDVPGVVSEENQDRRLRELAINRRRELRRRGLFVFFGFAVVIILAAGGEQASSTVSELIHNATDSFNHITHDIDIDQGSRPATIEVSTAPIPAPDGDEGHGKVDWGKKQHICKIHFAKKQATIYSSRKNETKHYSLDKIKRIQTSYHNASQPWNELEECYKEDIIPVSKTIPAARISVDFTKHPTNTTILGFGGAFTEASALNFKSLHEKGQEAVIELLFGENGLGYSLGRVHINSCDFSVKSYNFDDVDGDFNLSQFDTEVKHDVKSGMIEFIQRAQKKLLKAWNGESEKGLRLIASPWSPPAWMKLPTNEDGSSTMTGSAWPTCIREGTGPGSRYSSAWSLYFSKFITAYKNHNISIWGVTVQNEPEFAAPWEACAYTADEESNFVAYHLGPTLKKDHPEVKLFIFDHNKDHGPAWASTLMDPSNPAAKFIDGTGLHWYYGGMNRALDGAMGNANVHRLSSMVRSDFNKPDHLILGTESCHCPSTYYQSLLKFVGWSRAERYVHTVLADLAAGSNGWIEWNLILDSMGGPNHLGNLCEAPLNAIPHRAKGALGIPATLNFERADPKFGPVAGDYVSLQTLEDEYGFPLKYSELGVAVSPMYHYMGHISRYVRPGSVAVKALVDGTQLGTEGRIFRPSGSNDPGGREINDLSTTDVEITAWPCEGSVRQWFKFNRDGQFQVFGKDWFGNLTTNCISSSLDPNFHGLYLTDCGVRAGIFEQKQVQGTSKYHRFVLMNSLTFIPDSCLVINELRGGGGASGRRGGSQLSIGSCEDPSALWHYNNETGEMISHYFKEGDLEVDNGEVCMTTGWPFLQVGAFLPANRNDQKPIIIMNEADEPANFVLSATINSDGDEIIIESSIPGRAVETVLL